MMMLDVDDVRGVCVCIVLERFLILVVNDCFLDDK